MKKKNSNSAQSFDSPRNVMNDNSKFAIIEGYKIARTNLMFSLSAKNTNAVAVTSWSKGEGKSTVTSNLAISYAKMGKKVLLIDSDLRRPSVHSLLKINNEIGFSELLSKMYTFDEVVHHNVLPCLDVITVGAIPPNPSELLCSAVLPDLVEKWKKEYDYVIFDTPPIGVVADAMLLKSYVGGYVVVVREKVTSHNDIRKTLRNFELAQTEVLGFVLVGCTPQKNRFSKNSYDYDHYY